MWEIRALLGLAGLVECVDAFFPNKENTADVEAVAAHNALNGPA